jgi:hypothetical protein
MLFYCQANATLDLLIPSILDVLKLSHGVEFRILGPNISQLFFNLFIQV